MIIRFILYLLIIRVNDCSSSTLLERLRRQKTIPFQSSLSSSNEFNVNEDSKFSLTCSFLSNFHKIDLFCFHNGTLLPSFISKTMAKEEDDNIENSFLVVTILSTLEIEKTHLDMNGLYQCIGVHKGIYSQQTFHVHVIANKTNSIKTNFAKDALITIHTYQSLFEPRSYTILICRVSDNRKTECTTKWFDSENKPLNTVNEKNRFSIKQCEF